MANDRFISQYDQITSIISQYDHITSIINQDDHITSTRCSHYWPRWQHLLELESEIMASLVMIAMLRRGSGLQRRKGAHSPRARQLGLNQIVCLFAAADKLYLQMRIARGETRMLLA